MKIYNDKIKTYSVIDFEIAQYANANKLNLILNPMDYIKEKYDFDLTQKHIQSQEHGMGDKGKGIIELLIKNPSNRIIFALDGLIGIEGNSNQLVNFFRDFEFHDYGTMGYIADFENGKFYKLDDYFRIITNF